MTTKKNPSRIILIFLVLLLTNAGQVRGQEKQILNPVTITAGPQARSLMGINRSVSVLDSQELAQLPSSTLSGILDFVGGVDARQRGALGVQTDLSIRGSTFEQVLILLNGLRISDPQTGHHLMNLPVPLSQVARVEVLLGGASYIFGGQAFAGVVNIITKRSKTNRATLRAQGGSHESMRLQYLQELRGENHQTSLSAAHTRSDGFKANTDLERKQFSAQSFISLPDSQELEIAAGYNDQAFGAQQFYSSRFPDQYERTKALQVQASLKSQGDLNLTRRVYWRRHWDEFQLFREGPGFYRRRGDQLIRGQDTAPSWYSGANFHRSDVLGGQLEASFENAWGKTHLGGSYRLEQIRSNNLGDSLPAPVAIPGKRGAYTLGASRHNYAFSTQHHKEWEHWSLDLALQVNYNSAFDLNWLPGITLGYQLNNRHRFYASFNRSFRLPSYTDLYYNLGGAQGSENLNPEISHNYEVGYKWAGPFHLLRASLFRREGRQIIDWIQRCDTCVIRASNESRVNFNGLNLSLRFQELPLPDWLAWSTIHLEYQYIYTDEFVAVYESLYVLDYLRHQFTLRSSHRWNQWVLSYSLSQQQRRGQFRDARSGELRDYEPVSLINARLSYQLENAQFFLRGENLLDRRYYDRGNVELPGLWAWAGLEFQI